ncbi:MAG: glutaredoxin family protein [Nitrosomonadales bacterium]|nr:glutaredoxin family protein [Nitrosomonadales bacterium]
MNILTLSLLCSVLAATPVVAETLYKSVGQDGKITYSDKPPAEDRIEKTIRSANLPNTALPASTYSYVEQLRKKKAAAPARTSGVVLFTASWCGYCRQAKAYLAARGIAFREIDIDTSSGMAAYAEAGGGSGIPLLIAAGQSIQGFSPASYDALFARRK